MSKTPEIIIDPEERPCGRGFPVLFRTSSRAKEHGVEVKTIAFDNGGETPAHSLTTVALNYSPEDEIISFTVKNDTDGTIIERQLPFPKTLLIQRLIDMTIRPLLGNKLDLTADGIFVNALAARNAVELSPVTAKTIPVSPAP